MSYILNPVADAWLDGAICLPKAVCEQHLKFADEAKLKVLLLVAAAGKACSAESLASTLSLDINEVNECLAFWEGEGLLRNTEVPEQPASAPKKAEKTTREALPVPNLTPGDIVRMCSQDEALASLLRTAETTLRSTISHAMKSNLINMVTYYGLPVPVVITLLDYYKSARDSGKNISTRKLNQLAKEWADDEVKTLEEASQKLQELTSCDELWGEVIALCAFDYRKPTAAQLKMVARWRRDFDNEMIFFACNTMKKYNDREKQSLRIVDNILKEWKRKGFTTPEDVKKQPAKGTKTDANRLKSKPSFDIDEIKKAAALNDDFDI